MVSDGLSGNGELHGKLSAGDLRTGRSSRPTYLVALLGQRIARRQGYNPTLAVPMSANRENGAGDGFAIQRERACRPFVLGKSRSAQFDGVCDFKTLHRRPSIRTVSG